MMVKIQQKPPCMPISSLLNITYTHGGRIITIGKIPQKVKSFFSAGPTAGLGPRGCLLLPPRSGPVRQGQHAKGRKDKAPEMLSVPPISQLKTRMRQPIWQEEVQNVMQVSHEKTVIRPLEKLLAA